MKKYLLPMFCTLFIHNSFAKEPDSSKNFKPWKLEAQYLGVGQAKFDEPGRENQEIEFSQSKLTGTYTHHFNANDALVFFLGYCTTSLKWSGNPDFNETNFSQVNLKLGGYSTRFQNWVLAGGFSADVDSDEMDFSQYAQYKGGIWGRYTLSKDIGLHVGFAGTTGLRDDSLLPVLGFDYQHNEKWKLNLVFPRDLSAIYQLDDSWSLAATARSFRYRHRLSQKDVTSKGIFTYRSYGTELAARYNYRKFQAQAFTGLNWGGDLKTINSKGQNATFYTYKSALYLGSKLSYSF